MLTADKHYLVESRLLPLARKSGLSGIRRPRREDAGGAEGLIGRGGRGDDHQRAFFFRDKTPFDHFRETVFPALLQARAARASLRIWCAASSTGQEPYSLAMCLKDIGAAAGRLAHRHRRAPICRTTSWRGRGPASIASSRSSVACRSRCW